MLDDKNVIDTLHLIYIKHNEIVIYKQNTSLGRLLVIRRAANRMDQNKSHVLISKTSPCFYNPI